MDDTPPSEDLWLASTGYRLVKALEEARRLRPDLTNDEFNVLARQAIPTLSGHWGSAPTEILAYVDAIRRRRSRRRSPTGSPGRPRLREADLSRELAAALAAFHDEDEDRPTRAMIAERLGIDPYTLRRRLQRFPQLRELLPTSGRPRFIERT